MDRQQLGKRLATFEELPEHCKYDCDVLGGCAATMALYLKAEGGEKTEDTRLPITIGNAVEAARGCANVRVRSRSLGIDTETLLDAIEKTVVVTE